MILQEGNVIFVKNIEHGADGRRLDLKYKKKLIHTLDILCYNKAKWDSMFLLSARLEREYSHMRKYIGRYLQPESPKSSVPFVLVFLSFFLVEVFAFFFLSLTKDFHKDQLWPLVFGGLWAGMIACFLRLLPNVAARIVYGLSYLASLVYAGFQTGYHILFSGMMWLSDFRYASEGADYADVLLSYPEEWWLGLVVLLCQGLLIFRRFPRWGTGLPWKLVSLLLMAILSMQASSLPEKVFEQDENVKYAGSDYGRAKSAEAAYENMFDPHRLYQICGLYQTLAKDIYTHTIYPLTPGHARVQAQAEEEIDAWFEKREIPSPNAMTGLLEGKNVVLVLMESMDDWMIGPHTPTITKLMDQGITFTNFYTPVYGGIRTFNTEFCINTGSFLSSRGGYAFDYVTNTYDQSLASLLRESGYSAKTFHYNDPSFYSRGEFTPAMGYEEYVCYGDFLGDADETAKKNLLYDDCLLFDNDALNAEFFREGQPTLNFVITRSAHLSYKYNEVLSYWGLKKYPEYRGLTGNEETDCAYLKAKLVDDFFGRLLEELEKKGCLDNTVIIGVTDHYTYGYKDMQTLRTLSGVASDLLLEKTPCFIWSADLQPQKVDKVLNTSDLLPTVLNLLGVESAYRYMGQDAFDDRYDGFVPFSNGSWIHGDIAYDAKNKSYHAISGTQQMLTADLQKETAQRVQNFIRINNLILETDYYQ